MTFHKVLTLYFILFVLFGNSEALSQESKEKLQNNVSCLVRLDRYQYSLYLLDQKGGVKATNDEGLQIQLNFCNSLGPEFECSPALSQDIYASIKNQETCEELLIQSYEYLQSNDPEKGVIVHFKSSQGSSVDLELSCQLKQEGVQLNKQSGGSNKFVIEASSIYGCPTVDFSNPWSLFEKHRLIFSCLFLSIGLMLLLGYHDIDSILKCLLSFLLGLILTSMIYQQNLVENSWMSSIEVLRISLGVGLSLCAFSFSFKDLGLFINGGFLGYLIHLIIFNLILNDKQRYYHIYFTMEAWIVTLFGTLNVIYSEKMLSISNKIFGAVFFQIAIDLISGSYEYIQLIRGGKALQEEGLQYLYLLNTGFAVVAGIILSKFLKK